MLNNFVHIDAYRTGAKNLKILSWRDFVKNPRNIILIEWGDRIKKILPKSTLRIIFHHGENPNERSIQLFNI